MLPTVEGASVVADTLHIVVHIQRAIGLFYIIFVSKIMENKPIKAIEIVAEQHLIDDLLNTLQSILPSTWESLRPHGELESRGNIVYLASLLLLIDCVFANYSIFGVDPIKISDIPISRNIAHILEPAIALGLVFLLTNLVYTWEIEKRLQLAKNTQIIKPIFEKINNIKTRKLDLITSYQDMGRKSIKTREELAAWRMKELDKIINNIEFEVKEEMNFSSRVEALDMEFEKRLSELGVIDFENLGNMQIKRIANGEIDPDIDSINQAIKELNEIQKYQERRILFGLYCPAFSVFMVLYFFILFRLFPQFITKISQTLIG